MSLPAFFDGTSCHFPLSPVPAAVAAVKAHSPLRPFYWVLHLSEMLFHKSV
jgi:hypothetical protein